MKKLLALLCVAVMLVACCLPVFAAGSGSITINKTVKDQTYSIFKIADLESSSGSSYSYKVVPAWKNFFTSGTWASYFTLNGDYISIKAGWDPNSNEQFAKDALAYAAANSISATASVTEDEDGVAGTVAFTGLDLGYYLIDSTVGTLCALTTVTPNYSKDDKNELPNINKTVSKNSAEIGDVLTFTITVTKTAGAVNYTVHDYMTAGLTFNAGSLTIDNGFVVGTNCTLKTSGTCDPTCTFELSFDNAALAALADGTMITITYEATLNENAFIAGEGENKNEAQLKYGDNSDLSTVKPVAVVTPYKFDLVKTDGDKELLAGAIFELYDSTDTLVGLRKVDAYTYIVDPAGTDKITTVADKQITIEGLEAAVYYLKEVEAPAGYNKLTSNVSVDLSGSANITATMAGTTWTSGGIQITNNTGTVLPETGGFGTTMFLLIGGGLMLCTGILLVTKKRMDKIAD